MNSSSPPAWLAALARAHRAEHGPRCEGTVGYIDAAARGRGVSCVTSDECLSLARPIASSPVIRSGDGRASCEIEVYVDTSGQLAIGTDRVALDAHGLANTHLDGLTHIGVGGSWHSGAPCDDTTANDDSIVQWARHGLVTRAVLVDVPAARGAAWVENAEPVAGDEIERGVRRAGVELAAGDALLLYMGRDRFESAGNRLLPVAEAGDGRPGVDRSGAEWIADNRIGLLCWDLLDAHGHGVDALSVHLLVWAIGLAIVDNCELGVAARALGAKTQPTGLVVVSPLALHGATGCVVNPLLLY